MLPPSSQPCIFPSDAPTSQHEPSRICDGCLHSFLSFTPGRFVPHHGNKVCCTETQSAPESRFRVGSLDHIALVEPGSFIALSYHPSAKQRDDPDPLTVTQFPFLSVPITQHPTFACLWEVKQQKNSHCAAGGGKNREKGECVSTVSLSSSKKALV